jgi:Zn-dependent protease
MEHDEQRAEPLEIETFLPDSIELIDPRRRGEPIRMVPPQRPFRSRNRLVIFLFAATCVSTFLVGMTPGGGLSGVYFLLNILLNKLPPALVGQLGIDGQARLVRELLWNGVIFSSSLILILLAHEMGHYLQARRYGVPTSLPYFIPFPISPLGTMGAVIVQGAGVADRKMLFDIAISGPLAGLVVALPIAFLGVQNSKMGFIGPDFSGPLYGDPLILKWMIDFVHQPFPEGAKVVKNPLLFAGWVGIFITALNLIPIGQLDGGHLLYTLIGKRAHSVAILLLLGAVGYMIYSQYYAYGLMVVLLLLMGPRHPPTANDRVRLGLPRVVLGWLTLGFILIGFTPTPIMELKPRPRRPVPPKQQRSEPIVVDAKTVTPAKFDRYCCRSQIAVLGRAKLPLSRTRQPDFGSAGASPSQSREPQFSATQSTMSRYPSTFAFMNCSARDAKWSSDGNIRRQIFVAAASSGRAKPKASTTIQPS